MSKKQIPLKKLRNSVLKTDGRNHLPLPTGPHKTIGCRDILVGLSRNNGLLARLYYPAVIDSSNNSGELNSSLWPNWLPHETYWQGFSDVVNLQSEFMVSSISKMIRREVFIPAIPNAKLNSLPDDKKYPVVIFSHGLGGFRSMCSSICTELASHGFVVAALEHRDNSACLTFYPRSTTSPLKPSDQNLFEPKPVDELNEQNLDFKLKSSSTFFEKDLKTTDYLPHLETVWIRHSYSSVLRFNEQAYQFRNKQVHCRAQECIRCLDLLEALNAGKEINNLFDLEYNSQEFKNVLDMERITVMGHSFGGATTLLAAATDNRFKIAIAHDPWMFPIKNENLDLICQPTLIIFSETLSRPPNIGKIQKFVSPSNQNKAERRAFTIKGSNHWQQCDLPFTFKGIASVFARVSALKPTGPFVAHDLTCYHSLQFISKHLAIPLDDLPNRYIEEQTKLIRPLIS